MLDYELAAHNAWRRMRPNGIVNLRGCFFHFSQCLWRKLQRLQLQQMYNNDAEFKLWAKKILALPLLPTYEVEQAFNAIVAAAPGKLPAVLYIFSKTLGEIG